MKINRRLFLKKSVLTGGFIFAGGDLLAKKNLFKQRNVSPKIEMKENYTILFQGDSITDAYRLRTELDPNSQRGLGVGFAFMVAAHFLEKFPEKNFKFYNRGQGGNKITDLERRWQKDTIELKPDILTIVIGINDYFYHQKNGGTAEEYAETFRRVLQTTKNEMPNTQIIIGEPFVLAPDFVKPEFKSYQQYAKEIAAEFDAVFIPYQEIFDRALKISSKEYWARDNIHPNLAGASLMSKNWISVFE